ncbi:gliding motility lipoprotein GldH [Rufibacter immobilis]|uniref:Gliding motility lipoprotein GldH n=1 Tax=Rufibacter immobilis TaxID=1348778 RepID=A0A3M9N077_9BACT|nr:gliding motility lipoprotein GldH [Rufibacter immobilis]RNI30797.1 gliding motility lipoprotein GldH [Rufibacter immobilis]
MRKRLHFFFCLFCLGALLTSCDGNRVFEENQDIPNNQWPVKLAPVFTFEITDTTQAYNVYFNVRNALHYPFYNLYLRHYLTGPDGQQLSSALHEMFLMDPKTGEPKGSGAGDIFDHQFRALKNVRFQQVGTYRLKLNQYMRQDPLPGIMAVGVRVEKTAGQ